MGSSQNVSVIFKTAPSSSPVVTTLSYVLTILSCHKGRCVRSNAAVGTSSLIMSGSRGIGGLTCKQSNTIDLFDLEEDEDDSDDDESSEEEE